MPRKTNPVFKDQQHRVSLMVPGSTVLRIDREVRKLAKETKVLVTRSEVVRAALIQHFSGK